MTALELVLTAAVALLTVVIVVAVVAGRRVVRRFNELLDSASGPAARSGWAAESGAPETPARHGAAQAGDGAQAAQPGGGTQAGAEAARPSGGAQAGAGSANGASATDGALESSGPGESADHRALPAAEVTSAGPAVTAVPTIAGPPRTAGSPSVGPTAGTVPGAGPTTTAEPANSGPATTAGPADSGPVESPGSTGTGSVVAMSQGPTRTIVPGILPHRPEADRIAAEEQALASMRTAADDANAAVMEAHALAAAARTEAAAAKAEVGVAREEARRILAEARAECEALLDRAHRQAEQDAAQARTAARRAGEREVTQLITAAKEQAQDADRRQRRLDERERLLADEAERLADRDRRVAATAVDLAARETTLNEREAVLADAEEQRRRELERIAGLTTDTAKAELVESIEAQAKREAAILVRDIEHDARSTGEQRARHIVVEAIQRVASEQTAESVVSVLHLPSDEMKGRIIGREGRNIRAFESVTGVNLIIDDTPEAVLLSCFDPVRREIGRLTLEKLVLDGRIHPHRIEEVFDQARHEVERLCQRAAEDAMVEVGITDVHTELVTLLGRLRYRTSYGQNVLKHLLETAHIAGIMASELGLDRALIKRCAFLHDIGKALTHEVEGSHALIGADVARKYGESDEVVHAIEAHHNEVAPQTVEAVLTQASDACSGGRPGARRESLEAYVKRLERIEEIAGTKGGVEKVFAMQAGREVRVMVRPDDVDDIGAAVLARDVAKQIEEELTYPGQIRVTVVRESRVTEIAR